MKEALKRRLAMLLALIVIVCCMPEAAFALAVSATEPAEEKEELDQLEDLDLEKIAEETEVLDAVGADSGTCGENLTWALDDNGTLTISGTGR